VFTGPKETFVGPEYAASGLPRLVFLSLDSGSARTDPAMRTMEAVRRRELARDVQQLPKNKHWYLTHELALTLLKPFDTSLSIEGVSRHFAHVNSAKCCQNKPEHAKADRVLFKNCREYIGNEIGILHPDILVTQGKQARQAVEHVTGVGAAPEVTDEVCGHRIIQTAAGHRTIWFATYHPHNPKFWAQKRTCWSRYAEAAFCFVNGRPITLTDAGQICKASR
jgi:hypothetical protein